MQTTFTRLHKGLALFISLGVFLQMLLAGIWEAGVVNSPDAHALFGVALLAAALLALIAAAVARLPRPLLVRTALLFGLILLQPILIEFRGSNIPLLSAFHTLNAAFVGMTAGMVPPLASGDAHAPTPTTAHVATTPAAAD